MAGLDPNLQYLSHPSRTIPHEPLRRNPLVEALALLAVRGTSVFDGRTPERMLARVAYHRDMTRPTPTPIFHFGHIEHLRNVADVGLLCDAAAQQGHLRREIGNIDIKANRRGVPVKVAPGGTVDEYTPFYFAPRSPMLFVLNRQGLLEPHGGQAAIVYLCTTVDRLRSLGVELVFTDRNAVYSYAAHSNTDTDLDDFIDWPLMKSQWWNNTDDEPDRKERRMAECLAHQSVPWEGFLATKTQAGADQVSALVREYRHQPKVLVKPDWYY
jgi:hypothetical protein